MSKFEITLFLFHVDNILHIYADFYESSGCVVPAFWKSLNEKYPKMDKVKNYNVKIKTGEKTIFYWYLFRNSQTYHCDKLSIDFVQ